MRALWKGAITFGLVNVPIKLYPATEDHDISLHQVHDADGGRIRYQRRCEVCGKVVEYANIDKAYAEGKTTVVLKVGGLSAGKVIATGHGIKNTTKTITSTTVATITAKRTNGRPGKVTVSFDPAGPAKARKTTK